MCLINSVGACNDVGMSTPGMPLQAALIPDCTEVEAHHAAYRRAKTDDAIFVCIARQRPRLMVELDAMSCSGPTIPDEALTALQSAAEALVLADTVTQANVSPDYISMRAIESEQRAREIAAAFHAALHNLRQLYIAVPTGRWRV
ncbi:hypothetical protein [Streptomyces sp. NPDC047028]|uniref:hypothetical protein n=1 Tax=Streptomyces sp. NPDC047028 TaxID=3155793 RepID=UPI0033CAAD60